MTNDCFIPSNTLVWSTSEQWLKQSSNAVCTGLSPSSVCRCCPGRHVAFLLTPSSIMSTLEALVSWTRAYVEENSSSPSSLTLWVAFVLFFPLSVCAYVCVEWMAVGIFFFVCVCFIFPRALSSDRVLLLHSMLLFVSGPIPWSVC